MIRSAERRWPAASARGGVDLGEDLARGGAPLDGDRGEHARPEGSRATACRGESGGSKELAEYLEVEGYAKAAQWVYGQAVEQSAEWSGAERINLTELRQIHRLVVEPAWLHAPPEGLRQREDPGSFRQHDIRPFSGGMMLPPLSEVPALVTDWLRDANRGPADGQHAMVFVADVHARFVRIHPVRDGNGRVGRLATNLLLVRHGYPPAVIHKRDRTRYLNALRRADRGDPEPLAEMFARAVTDGIHRFLLPDLAGPHRLVPLRSLADGELSGNALAVAAKLGRLQQETGIKPEWAAEAFDDLEEDVRQSIARIKNSPFIPKKDHVRGFIYDVKSGHLDEVS